MFSFDPENPQDNSFLTAVAFAFGLVIAVLAYTIAPISGGHINPAVTFAFVLLGDMKITTGLMYVGIQCLGAVLGAALVWGSTAWRIGEDTPPFLLGVNQLHPDISQGSAFLGEAMGTFVLVWTVMMTAVYKKNIAGNLAPLAIGWSVTLAHLVLIPYTGCGINPARSFGPMLVDLMAGEKVGHDGWWVYYTAPFLGAGIAALTTKYLFGVLADETPAESPKEVDEKEDEVNA